MPEQTELANWPTLTVWVVNGERFADLCEAQDYADKLERQGQPVRLTRREEPQ